MTREKRSRALLRRMRNDPLPYACLAMVGVSVIMVAATLASLLRV